MNDTRAEVIRMADAGAPTVTLVRCRYLRDALCARCESCNTIIEYNGFWSLGQSIGLHERGSCRKPKITYWRFA